MSLISVALVRFITPRVRAALPQLRFFIVFRNRQLWAWSNVFQAVRFAYNDHAPKGEEDWHRPFVAAMFAWQEDTYRKSLGLPSSLEPEGDVVNLRALWYSIFMNRVMNGDANPLAAWRADLAEYEKGA